MPAMLKNRSKRRMDLVDTERDMASSPRMVSCLHDKVAIALSALQPGCILHSQTCPANKWESRSALEYVGHKTPRLFAAIFFGQLKDSKSPGSSHDTNRDIVRLRSSQIP